MLSLFGYIPKLNRLRIIMSLSERVLAQDAWKTSIDQCTQAESIRLCYERARFLCRESGL